MPKGLSTAAQIHAVTVRIMPKENLTQFCVQKLAQVKHSYSRLLLKAVTKSLAWELRLALAQARKIKFMLMPIIFGSLASCHNHRLQPTFVSDLASVMRPCTGRGFCYPRPHRFRPRVRTCLHQPAQSNPLIHSVKASCSLHNVTDLQRVHIVPIITANRCLDGTFSELLFAMVVRERIGIRT